MINNQSLKGKICESFFANNLEAGKAILESIISFGELRFDMSKLAIDELKSLKNHTEKSLIFTNRKSNQTENGRLNSYTEAIQLGFDFIDLDFSFDQEILLQLKPVLKKSKTKLILSIHYFDHTPQKEELLKTFKSISLHKPHIIKLATKALTIKDLDVLESLQNENTICIAMGDFATESRIKSLKNDTTFTYVSYNKKETTAIGQINYQDFQDAFTHYRGAENIKLAVIGSPIAHSKSPAIFKGLFESHRINGVYHKLELKKMIDFIKIRDSYDGFNITAPFKQSIIKFLDNLSPAAEVIGAVNTIYKKDNLWVGENTDYIGILDSINEHHQLTSIKNCLILGAGGAARAAAYAMNISGIDTNICNRTNLKAEELANSFGQQSIKKDDLKLKDFQLIINTTPTPLDLIDENQLTNNHIILDAIYPLSVFLDVKHKGFILIQGEKWLLEQAKASFQLFIPNEINGK